MNFKSILAILLLAISQLLSVHAIAQGFSFASQTWADQQLGKANGVDVVTDMVGNTYVAGNYTNTVYFDALEIGGNYGVMFVAKYDPQGDVVWVRHINGNSNNTMIAIDIDPSANIYVTGDYTQTNSNTVLDFGAFTVTGNGSSSTFIAKIDSAGAWQWVNTILSTGPSSINSREVRPNDMVYTSQGLILGGRVREKVTIDGTDYNETNENTFFFARFNADGTHDWFKNGTGPLYDLRLETRSDNSFAFTGHAQLISPTYDGLSISTMGNGDALFGAINLDGALMWWNIVGHQSFNEQAKDISVDQNNNIFLTIRNSIYVIVSDTTIYAVGAGNWSLFKFSNTGEFQWMQPLTSSMSGNTYNHLTTPAGITFVTGFIENPQFSSPVQFWTESIGGFGAKEAYFSAYSPNGTFLDVTGFVFEDGGDPTNLGEFIPGEMRFDHQGKIVITGKWHEPIIIGNDTLVNSFYPHQTQMFLIKADPSELFDLSTAVIQDKEIAGNRLIIYPNPTTSELFFKENFETASSYRILNSLGTSVQEGKLYPSQNSLNIEQLAAGKYFLQIIDGLKIQVAGFVKQ